MMLDTQCEFYNNLQSIHLDLQSHKETNKTKLMENYIKQRLNESLKSYSNDLEQSITYLSQRDEFNVQRKLNTLERESN